jgi:hypothetical protein
MRTPNQRDERVTERSGVNERSESEGATRQAIAPWLHALEKQGEVGLEFWRAWLRGAPIASRRSVASDGSAAAGTQLPRSARVYTPNIAVCWGRRPSSPSFLCTARLLTNGELALVTAIPARPDGARSARCSQAASPTREAFPKRTARGLKVLRERIAAAGIPSSKLDESLNIATWNIRKFRRRPRLPASLHYIAEIIGQLDLVALVELRDDVKDLARVLRYLGPYWRVLYSDSLRDAGGNHERIAYVYDERACEFTGLASYALPRRTKNGDEYLQHELVAQPVHGILPRRQLRLRRSLRAHRWGANAKGRVPELEQPAEWVYERSNDPELHRQGSDRDGRLQHPA